MPFCWPPSTVLWILQEFAALPEVLTLSNSLDDTGDQRQNSILYKSTFTIGWPLEISAVHKT